MLARLSRTKILMLLGFVLVLGLTACASPTPTPVPFMTSSLQVRSLHKIPLDLPVGARVEYSFSGDRVDFWVTDPDGNPIKEAYSALRHEGAFVADRPGRFNLVSVNSSPLIPEKNVLVTFRVTPLGGR
jgi:hypothetical protein